MKPKPKALPPASGKPSLGDSLDMAMDGVSLAIDHLLADRTDNHRFSEVMRLATIGRALGRQKARASNSVADFVPRHQRRRNRYARFVCNNDDVGLGGMEDMQDLRDVEGIADDPDDDPEDDAVQGAVNRLRRNVGRPRWVGAPHGLGGNEVDEALAQGMEAVRPLVDQLRETSDRRLEIEEREAESNHRLDLARELEALTNVRDRMRSVEEQTAIQKRIDALMAELGLPPVDDDEADEHEADDAAAPEPSPRVTQLDPDLPTPPEPPSLRIRCTACGNVHGRHWVTTAGVPRDCDICNSATTLEVAPDNPDPQPRAAEG